MFTLRYLLLRNESGYLLVLRDIIPLSIAIVLYGLLAYFVDRMNFFGPAGFVDRVGALTSTLTGFYVAALVGAATFASGHADLDKEIPIGPLHQRIPTSEGIIDDQITRREYVCAIFGYVSLLAMAISIVSIICVTVSGAVKIPAAGSSVSADIVGFAKYIFGLAYTMSVAHLLVTTAHGLCCTNRVMGVVSLSPDRLIPRPQ
jgi:hypothetical protein